MVSTLPTHRMNGSFSIPAIKCKISILNPRLETTTGWGDLAEHWAELGGAEVKDGLCTCHFDRRKSVSSPGTWAVTDSAAARDETLQTGLQLLRGARAASSHPLCQHREHS